jgi:hypothetical protein
VHWFVLVIWVRQKFDEKEHGNKLYGHDSKIGGRVLSNLLSSVMLSNLINFFT